MSDRMHGENLGHHDSITHVGALEIFPNTRQIVAAEAAIRS